MNSDWWKCGKYASSQLWGVHIFDDVCNMLGTSYSTWWDLRQIAAKFVPICCKVTRNRTNLLCARAYRNRPKRNETSILSSEREMKARFMVMTQEQSNSPSQWRTEGGGLGVQTPPPKFRRPSKIVPNSTQLWKLLKVAEFRTPTPQYVRKKGSKILKLPRFAILLH